MCDRTRSIQNGSSNRRRPRFLAASQVAVSVHLRLSVCSYHLQMYSAIPVCFKCCDVRIAALSSEGSGSDIFLGFFAGMSDALGVPSKVLQLRTASLHRGTEFCTILKLSSASVLRRKPSPASSVVRLDGLETEIQLVEPLPGPRYERRRNLIGQSTHCRAKAQWCLSLDSQDLRHHADVC